MSDERRQETRYPLSGSPIKLWVSENKNVDALVLEASKPGAAVIVPADDVTHISTGDQLRIIKNGLEQIAVVRNIEAFGVGQRRLGIMWGSTT